MIKEKIKEIMQVVFELNEIPDDISQSSLKSWDSLSHLNLAVAIEDNFGISLEPEDIEKMVSLNMIIEIVESKA